MRFNATSSRRWLLYVTLAGIVLTLCLLLTGNISQPHLSTILRFIDQRRRDDGGSINFTQSTAELSTTELHKPLPVCRPTWPQFDMFLTLGPKRLDEYTIHLLPTLRFFWPLSRLDLLIVIDDEMHQRDEFGVKMKNDFRDANKVTVKTNKPSKYYGPHGWHRQQLIMFYADNFTTAEYVGFIDTDTVFVASPDEGDMFENGKPVFLGKYGTPGPNEGGPRGEWAHAPIMTRWALNKDEVMKSMAHFPLIIKTRHLAEMRDYMVKLHNVTSFNDVFLKMMQSKKYFSQFNIMCAYIYHFHRSDYVWRVQLVSGGWGNHAPEGKAKSLASAGVTLAEQEPFPRLCIHGDGHHGWGERSIDDLMRIGYCYSNLRQPTNISARKCRPHLRSPVFGDMYVFEFADWNWHPHARRNFEQRQLRQKQKRCVHNWDTTVLKRLGLIV